MWLKILLFVVQFVAVLFALKQLVATAIRNVRIQRNLRKRSPKLPIAAGAGMFGGHLNNLIMVRRSWRKLEELHKKLGRTYGLFYCEKPCVITTDLDFIKAVLLDRPNDHLNRCRFNTPLEEFEKDNVLTSDEKQWRRLRNAISPAFTKTKMMMPNVQSDVKKVIEELVNSFETKFAEAEVERSERSIKLDVDDLSLRYAHALVFSCFYKQDQLIDFDSKIDPITNLLNTVYKSGSNPIVRFCIMFPVFVPIINWLMLRFHPIGVMRNKIMAFVKKQTLLNLQARQQLKDAELKCPNFDPENFTLKDGSRFRKCIVDYMTDQFHDGKLTTSEYLNNAFFLFLASSKSSADAISKLLYNLASNQEEQEKLRSSILTEGVESKYLQWSIYESMRLFPPAPISMRRLSHDMVSTDGFLIPGGTILCVSAALTGRLKEYWGPDADKFKPERWQHAASFHPIQFMVFGAGKRKCFGADFSMAEMKMLMTELLSRYRFKCPPETNEDTIMDFDTYIIFTISHSPVNIEITKL